MDLVLDLLATVSRWSRGNLSEISLALVGCLLVLFGSDVKGRAEQRLGSLGGALRVPFMAVMVMVGSGAALIYATPWVVKGKKKEKWKRNRQNRKKIQLKNKQKKKNTKICKTRKGKNEKNITNEQK